jgi:hypothetical protein
VPSRRETLNRPRRNRLTDEAIALFRRLSAMPPSARKGPEWKAQSQRLAELLGLENEWWAMWHVEDEPHAYVPEDNSYQIGCCRRVAEVREQLLAATKLH